MKKIQLSYIIGIGVFLVVACQSPGPSVQRDGALPDANLSQDEAMRRSQAIANVAYDLSIQLDEKSDNYKAQEQVHFELKGDLQGLFLDFKDAGKIDSLAINGKTLQPQFTNHRLTLPASELRAGMNAVDIHFVAAYSHEGRGLHRFVDPQDGRVYLYSQFEAFDAHEMFPCFDQPDIKSTMKMTVTAPKSWEVITTVRESDIHTDGDIATWTFPETPRISSYLFSLHAGPYFKWESTAGAIPLRLFVRQSLKQYVTVKDWFTPTKAGLKFYGDYFAYPYPFKKYDQIIVPEFNAGAMENVAAITFSERYIHRGPTTKKDREDLSDTLLHEMAHMWFGDLVTMKWWNGLWLNESFATYMSHLAGSSATEFADTWVSFHQWAKASAYKQDQQVTTHPIDGAVADTNSAFANFDAITYGKGASVLKQLHFYLGNESFRKGVRYYFKTYAYQNARLEDFIGALEHESKKDLHTWSTTWLRTAGVDTVEADFDCNDGRISRFALKLTPPAGESAQRVHSTLVGLFAKNGGAPYKTERVEYQNASTPVLNLVGVQCPTMVYPNTLDNDYVKVQLDRHTLAGLAGDVTKISSPLARLMIWVNLHNMVRDVKITPQDYLKMVETNLPKETNYTVGESIIWTLPTLIYYLPKANDQQKQVRTEIIQRLEQALWNKALHAAPGSDWQRLALGGFTDISESSEARDLLVGLLNDNVKLKGLVLDVDRRWSMVIHLMSLGDSRAQPMLAALEQTDQSNRGIESAYAAEAAQPTADVKRAWLAKVVDHDDLSFSQKRKVMDNLLPSTQDELRAALADSYYENLPKLIKAKDLELSTLYTRALVPTTCSQASVSNLESFLKNKTSDLPAPVLKVLRTTHQEDGRCVAIRSFATAAENIPNSQN